MGWFDNIDWAKVGGYTLAGLSVAAGVGIAIGTGGTGTALGLAIAGAGLKAGGAIVEADTTADNANTLADQNADIADASKTEAYTSAQNSYKIDANDGVTSLAERHLASLESSLVASRAAAVENADEAATQFEYSQGQSLETAGLQEGAALQRAARSGVRVGRGSSITAGLVQSINSINGAVSESQRAQDASMDIAANNQKRNWAAGQTEMADYTASANEGYRSNIAAADLGYKRSSILTQQYRDQASAAWVNGGFDIASAGLGLLGDLSSMGLLSGSTLKRPDTDISLGGNKYSAYEEDYRTKYGLREWTSGYRSK